VRPQSYPYGQCRTATRAELHKSPGGIEIAREVHASLDRLDGPALEGWRAAAVSRLVWFVNQEHGAEPAPEPEPSSFAEPEVLPVARVCLSRSPQADRLAAVVALLLHGQPDELGELERAVLVPVERTSWEAAVRASQLPAAWRDVENFVVSGNHRVASRRSRCWASRCMLAVKLWNGAGTDSSDQTGICLRETGRQAGQDHSSPPLA